MTGQYVIIILVDCLAIIVFILLLLASFSLAPWMPSRHQDLERINRLAALDPGQIFYELGCGNGRVCFYIAKHNPKAKIIGVELFFLLYLWAQFRSWWQPNRNARIIWGNALKKDLSGADVIYVFGTNYSMNKKLKDKFIKEMKAGAKVLSYVFAMRNWPGKTMVDQPKGNKSPIFIYKKP